MTTCPKCGYVRKPVEAVPDWECPACNIAYAKYHAPASPAATAPPPPAALRPPPTPEQQAGARAAARMVQVVLGVAVGVWGLYILWLAYSGNGADFYDGGRAVLASFGFFVLSVGFLPIATGLALGEGAQRAAWHAFVLALAWVFTAVAFALGLGALDGMSVGPLNGGDLVRLASVAFDIYVVSSVVLGIVREAAGTPEAERHRLARVAGSIALAAALQVFGALDSLYHAFGVMPPGPMASAGLIKVSRRTIASQEVPLEFFAGAWSARYKGLSFPGSALRSNWIARAEIRVADGKASARLWRPCPPRECEVGVFPARIEMRHRGRVVALHFAGTTSGMDWTVSMLPQGSDLYVDERHIVGKDWSTHQQGGDQMRREK